MAIKWKTSIPEWTNLTVNGTTYTLCSADDDMSSIKSVSIVNGNQPGTGTPVYISIFIDTSGMDTSSPEYSTTPIYLSRFTKVEKTEVVVFSSIINNATWSSKGAVLKCSILPYALGWTPIVTPSVGQGHWFSGSIILSGQDKNANSSNIIL